MSFTIGRIASRMLSGACRKCSLHLPEGPLVLLGFMVLNISRSSFIVVIFSSTFLSFSTIRSEGGFG